MTTRDLLLMVFVVILLTSGGVVVYDKTRGLRNNNPGNIRHGDAWQGMSPNQGDSAFVQFISPEYGIRAMARVLANYASAGVTTVRGIISRWAPPGDNNDTAAYIDAVASHLGVRPDAQINVVAALPQLIPAIIQHENGIQPYSAATINRGIGLAV
jgi:hypothetical protein